MKRLSKLVRFSIVGAVLAITAVIGASPIFASSPGQLAKGPYIYRVKDVTTNSAFASTANASAGDTLQYKVELDNGGYGGLTNVMVNASLPSASSTSNTSNMTATPAEGATFGTNGSVTVSLSSAQSLSYINGTTVLTDKNGNVISNLPDTITTSGVNAGTIPGSTIEYLTFEAKVSIPPVTPPHTPPATVLPNTGPGDMLGAFAGASAVGGVGHYFVSRRRR